MLIKILRDRFTPFSTEGRLFIGADFECYTLEPRRYQGFGKPFCTPDGKYLFTVKPSVHFGRKVICVERVPGFTAIEVHPGNFPKDTHGCTLVGQNQGTDFVGHSEAAFEILLAKVGESGTIEYISDTILNI